MTEPIKEATPMTDWADKAREVDIEIYDLLLSQDDFKELAMEGAVREGIRAIVERALRQSAPQGLVEAAQKVYDGRKYNGTPDGYDRGCYLVSARDMDALHIALSSVQPKVCECQYPGDTYAVVTEVEHCCVCRKPRIEVKEG